MMGDVLPFKSRGIGLGFQEFEPGDTLGVDHGGTGSTTPAGGRVALDVPSNADLDNHTLSVSNPHAVTAAQVGAIPATLIAVPNGVASLDAGGKIPIGQIPAISIPSVFVVADEPARLALVVQEGDESIQLDDDSHWLYDGVAWHVRGATSIVLPPFGSEFNLVESLSVDTTTSESWQGKATLSVTVPLGKYRLGVSYGWNHDATGDDFEGRVLLDGGALGQIHKQEPKDSSGSFGTTGTDQRHQMNRVHYVDLTGSHTFELEYRTSKKRRESSIWDVVLELWRVT